ncbi:MAG: hypothetical protein ACYC0H_06860 [Solirubrobacteraceae bacterium]
MTGHAWRPTIASVASAALLVAGCGGSSGISRAQLQAKAQRACTAAVASLAKINSPKLADDAGAFLSQGVAVIAPEVRELSALHPDGSLGASYRNALSTSRAELADLRRALHEIRREADPIATVQALQSQLAPLELEAGGAWTALGLPVCADG